MGTIRSQPFGYKMGRGKMVISSGEASWIPYLFEQYLLGASYKGLAEDMNKMGVRYDGERQWNKNTVARVLQDRRYTGVNGYPRIIDPAVFQQAEDKRQKIEAVPPKTEAQKSLRRKCGCRITPHIEHEVLYLLNGLSADPEQIKVPTHAKALSPRVKEREAELDALLARLPVEENRAKELLWEIAKEMYESLDSGAYETQRIRRIFQAEVSRTELDSGLIGEVISEVMADSKGNVKIKLKNGQIMERRK